MPKPNPTTKVIGYKRPSGSYAVISKTFNNESHFENWYDYMSGKGYKITGVQEEEEEINQNQS